MRFTARQRQVVELLACGKSNREIGYDLDMGERTVKRIVSALLAKTGFTSRADLAGWCWGHAAITKRRR